jgi:hypothetical protein
MPACGERKRNEKGKFYLIRERKMRASKIHGTSSYLGRLNIGPPDLFLSDISGANKWQSTLSFKSSVLLSACFFYPSMRVF